MVGETVEQGPGQAFGAEHFGPFVEGQIAGQQGGTTLVTLREYLEQEFRAGFAERHEAEFVDDQQFVFCQLFLEPQQAFLIPGLSLLFIPSAAENLEYCIRTGYPFRHA